MIYNSVELRSVYVNFNFGITSIGIWETVYRIYRICNNPLVGTGNWSVINETV